MTYRAYGWMYGEDLDAHVQDWRRLTAIWSEFRKHRAERREAKQCPYCCSYHDVFIACPQYAVRLAQGPISRVGLAQLTRPQLIQTRRRVF